MLFNEHTMSFLFPISSRIFKEASEYFNAWDSCPCVENNPIAFNENAFHFYHQFPDKYLRMPGNFFNASG
jgi:hypothetical protein